MNKFVVIFATVVAGLVILEQSYAIQCFVCNSFHQADCSDWFDNVTQHLVKCPGHQTKCRKVVQETWLEDHWDVRYIRQCAMNGKIGARDGKECQEIYGTYNIRVRQCHCDNQDGCNTASRINTNISFMLPTVVTLLMLLLRHYNIR